MRHIERRVDVLIVIIRNFVLLVSLTDIIATNGTIDVVRIKFATSI